MLFVDQTLSQPRPSLTLKGSLPDSVGVAIAATNPDQKVPEKGEVR